MLGEVGIAVLDDGPSLSKILPGSINVAIVFESPNPLELSELHSNAILEASTIDNVNRRSS